MAGEVLRLLVAEQAEPSGKRRLLHLNGFPVLQGSPFVPRGDLIATEQLLYGVGDFLELGALSEGGGRPNC